jgi:hypothetical protein
MKHPIQILLVAGLCGVLMTACRSHVPLSIEPVPPHLKTDAELPTVSTDTVNFHDPRNATECLQKACLPQRRMPRGALASSRLPRYSSADHLEVHGALGID